MGIMKLQGVLRKWYGRELPTAHNSLSDDGLMVIVFAHKDPAAWETLTTAMIGAGLVVTASWPIDTEIWQGWIL